ncbi:MAG: hypothetical protein FJ217_12945 [Ignavibacteria bacterium]|nr:hypothetical protein [Ignavibacteria bacterium]
MISAKRNTQGSKAGDSDTAPYGFVVDVTGRTVLALTGPDAQDLLQRLSTNDVSHLKRGESTQTILTNEKGRIVEVVSAVKLEEGSILLVGLSTQPDHLVRWIEKYIIMEDAKVEVVNSDFYHYLIYSIQMDRGVKELQELKEGSIVFWEQWTGIKLCHVLLKASKAAGSGRVLDGMGFRAASLNEYEEFRILNGIPHHPNELSELINPLEADLGSFISWTKGCYIGQEVIARMVTYKKVQKRLLRLALGELPGALPQVIYSDEGESGVITSAVRLNRGQGARGLGYVKVGYLESDAEAMFFRHLDSLVPVRLLKSGQE